MNTLRQIGEFVGLGNATPPHVGRPIREQITMRAIGNRVPLLSSSERTSMRAMIRGLQALPPISLEVEAVELTGEVPFSPEIRLLPSHGVILETYAALFQNGQKLSEDPHDHGASGGLVSFVTVSIPGYYQLEVRRIGIPNTGVITLRKTFNVTARSRPAPPPPPPPPPVPPLISVKSNGDGSFVVSGSKFLPNKTVHIRVVDAAFTTLWIDQSSDSQGTLEYPTGKLCQGPGQLHFSANDGRDVPSAQDRTGVLWSNTVTTTCPA